MVTGYIIQNDMQTHSPPPKSEHALKFVWDAFQNISNQKKNLVKIFWNNFMDIDFSKNSHDTFFVDHFNLNNSDMSEIFWEINIFGVIGRVHFW